MKKLNKGSRRRYHMNDSYISESHGQLPHYKKAADDTTSSEKGFKPHAPKHSASEPDYETVYSTAWKDQEKSEGTQKHVDKTSQKAHSQSKHHWKRRPSPAHPTAKKTHYKAQCPTQPSPHQPQQQESKIPMWVKLAAGVLVVGSLIFVTDND